VPGVQVRPTWVGRQLHVGVLRTPARLVSSARSGDDLALEVDLDPAGAGEGIPAAAEFVLARQGGRTVQAFGAELHNEGPALRVRGLIPLATGRWAWSRPRRPGTGPRAGICT
jgi:hypothetical protein